MRHVVAIFALLAPALALAEKPYSPKFARQEQGARVLAPELCPKPEYPKSSLRNEESGTVILLFTIAPTGRVSDTKLARSSGFRDLDRASIASLSHCRFRPASVNGTPVQGFAPMQYVWVLD